MTRSLLLIACLAAPQPARAFLVGQHVARLRCWPSTGLVGAARSCGAPPLRVTSAMLNALAPEDRRATPAAPARGRGGRGARGARGGAGGRGGRGQGSTVVQGNSTVGRGQDDSTAGRGGRGGRGANEARKTALRAVCAAVRSNAWTDVNASLSGGMRWGRGEWRAMVQAASEVADWKAALRLLDAMSAAGLAADGPAYGHALVACARAGELDAPMQLLQTLADAHVVPELRPINQLITAAGKSGRWKLSLSLLEKMTSLGVIPSTISYNSALSALSRAGMWEEASALLGKVPSPDVVSYSTVIAACQKGGAAQQVLELLQQMNNASDAVAPNAVTFTAAVTALADAGRWKEALQTFDSMPEGMERSEGVLHAAVVAAAGGAKWRRALQLLGSNADADDVAAEAAEAEAGGEAVVPRAASFNVAIRACADARQPAAALRLLRRMCNLGVKRSLLSYNAALGALAPTGLWEEAVGLLDQMEVERVRPTLVSFNQALAASAKAARGDVAMALLERIRLARLTPDVVSYTSAISAFSRAGDVAPVLGLLGAMEEGETEPDGWTWSAAISACERAGEWQQAIALFDGLRQAGGGASEAVWNAAISAAGAGGELEMAVGLLGQMREAGFEPGLRALNACLKAAERAGEGDAALTLLSEMPVAPDAISYTLVVGALGRCGRWESALGVWGAMLGAGIEPDVPALSTLLRALTAAGETATALRVYDAAHDSGWRIARSAQAVCAAIDAAAAQGDARKAVALFGDLKADKGTPSAGCYRAVIEACAGAAEWRVALGLWEEMVRAALGSTLVPDARAHRAAFAACRAAGEEGAAAASRIAKLAEEQGVPLIALEEEQSL